MLYDEREMMELFEGTPTRELRRNRKAKEMEHLKEIKPVACAIIREVSEGVYVKRDIYKSEKAWKKSCRKSERREAKRELKRFL